MEFNKCDRCGCFFVSNNSVCPNCATKDQYEMNQLKDFLEENANQINIENLSNSTGISVKNINRFLGNEQFADFKDQIQGNCGNISVEL